MERIKLLVADNNEIIRAGIRTILAREKNMFVVGTAKNAEEIYKKIQRKNPDIIVLDLCPSPMSTSDVTEYITKNFPAVKVIIFTSASGKKCIADGFKAGAWGYVLKNNNMNHLLQAINTVYNGEKYAGSNIMDICLSKFIDIISNGNSETMEDVELTSDETELIKLLTGGSALNEIAEEFKIKTRSVTKRKNKLMKKLQLNDLTDLVKYAIKNGIIEM